MLWRDLLIDSTCVPHHLTSQITSGIFWSPWFSPLVIAFQQLLSLEFFYFFKYLRESFPCFYWLFLENPQHAFTFWIISPLHYALKSILVLIKPKNYFFEVEESKVYFLFIQIFFSLDLVLAFYYFIRQSNGDEYHLSLYC